MTDFPMPWAESEDRESLHLLDRKRMTVRVFRDTFGMPSLVSAVVVLAFTLLGGAASTARKTSGGQL